MSCRFPYGRIRFIRSAVKNTQILTLFFIFEKKSAQNRLLKKSKKAQKGPFWALLAQKVRFFLFTCFRRGNQLENTPFWPKNAKNVFSKNGDLVGETSCGDVFFSFFCAKNAKKNTPFWALFTGFRYETHF